MLFHIILTQRMKVMCHGERLKLISTPAPHILSVFNYNSEIWCDFEPNLKSWLSIINTPLSEET